MTDPDPLLAPLRVGTRRAPNRVLFGPHVTNLGRGRGLSDRHVAYYARRARGGCGIVVVETASVHTSDWPYERAPLAELCRPGWREIADACHETGSIALAAIGHAGGQGSSAYSRTALWAPSGVPEVNARELPKAMEPEDVEVVVRSFGAAARGAVESGLDGVEVNAGQHSLVRQFLSGLTNQRQDGYGEDRLRFAREVLDEVRTAVGDAVVGLRLCIDELAPWAGITPETALAIARELAVQADYLVLVRGSIYSVPATRPDCHEPEGFNLQATGPIRAGLEGAVPVFAQGSIVDPAAAARAVADGVCDGVEMTRAQIADAELVRKVSDRRMAEIRPCLLCNQACQVLDVRNPLVSCVADPRSGYETSEPPEEGPDGEARTDVLVVGGGPAGLEAARVAALRGHAVRLVERDDRLGGLLRTSAAAPGRRRLAALVDWLERECRRLGVELVTGHEATAAEISAHEGPVVLATGSIDGERPFAVEPGGHVVSAAGLFAGAGLPEGPALVWDPIGGPIGISAAELLADRGVPTALVTPDQIAGTQLSRTGDLVAANGRLRRAGVAIVRRSVLRAVRAGEAEVEDVFGAGTRVLPAAVVVDAGHRLPAPGPDAPDAIRVGDAVAPRTALEAVLEGRRAIRQATLAAVAR